MCDVLLFKAISKNYEQIKCGSLNVCGLKRKTMFPEFVETVKYHDLFITVETK